MKDRVIEVVCQEPYVSYRARWTASAAFSPAFITLDKELSPGVWHSVLTRNLPTDEKDECIRLRRELAWLRSGSSLKQCTFSGTSNYDDVAEYLASSPPKGWTP